MVGARVRRQQVAYAQARGLSSRRACALLSVARSTLGLRQSRLVGARCAGACRRCATLAGAVSAVRLSDDPDLPGARGPRDERRPDASAVAPGGAAGAATAARAGAWPPAAHGRCRRRRSITCGRTTSCSTRARTGAALKCLTVIDEFTRECLAIDVAGGIRSGRVIEVLTQLVSVHGAPRYLRSDNGPEFVARAILRWLQTRADRDGVHRSGQAVAEWHRRIVQREVPRRVLDAAVVSESRRRQGRHRAVAAALQRGAART